MLKKHFFPLIFLAFSAAQALDSERVAPLHVAIKQINFDKAQKLLASIKPTDEEKQFLLDIAQKMVAEKNNKLKRAERFVPSSGIYQVVTIVSGALMREFVVKPKELSFWKGTAACAGAAGGVALILEIPEMYADRCKSRLAEAMKIRNLFVADSCGTITLDLRDNTIKWDPAITPHQESGDDNQPSTVS